MKIKAYLATHFFDLFGFEGTKHLAERIRNETKIDELYVPQENGEINDKKNNDTNITDIAIYKADTDKLLESNILIAYIDGCEIDSGISAEIGVFAGALETMKYYNIPHEPAKIIGLYTDMRQYGTGDNHMYKNLYTTGAIRKNGVIVSTVDDLIKEINLFIKKYYQV